ncbi:VCBS repeat-containing protein [Flavobacteriaceae bacterium TP-CH-4]|uniref:VCBS repeat-containing protein n=1 Tax=Pelagihabitans pacificus TaxID=2696054 RepID=A0A967EEP6_9FLAO|nr:VCBS repeat-containing protein [Pelagihabitans pacificus]NHF60588.1 VCBS repeat-containing protein [Pelagihabitans pacificus]
MFKTYLLIGLAILAGGCKQTKPQRFELLPASRTGIDFRNTIIENDSINVFQYMNVYTGAGVAVGDIDNDGLVDVYFGGNMESGRLYRNLGDFKFEDITATSGLLNNRWETGVTMVDINQDGFLDLYVCVSGGGKISERANLLYINNGDLTYTEKASEYGLDDTRQSMHAAFFDYDRDQDLDMYLLVNPAAYEYKVNVSKPRELNGQSVSNDRLYRNEGDGTFVDVSLEAGILVEGYGLGVGISDINGDDWPDIYVSNDFIGNDILYINQKDGTFRDGITEHIKHTSYAGMGNDLADIDNNGNPDIMVLDMRPEDNKRQKLIISSTGYDRFQLMLKAGYNPQYSRNTLQINQGGGKFSEIGFLAGISSTDWSWSPLLADYDNDGHKDLYVTNGFLRDLGNLDYIHYQGIYDNPLGTAEAKIEQKKNSIKELPKADLVNYSFRNKGNMTFEKVSEEWGFDKKSCSNGAAFADLDNDGDLDLLVNNVDQPAFVYRNLSEQRPGNNFLRLALKGKVGNLQGIGTKVKITTGNTNQYYQHFLSRGYESSVDPTIHFGLDTLSTVDLIEVWWPDGSYHSIKKQPANQLLIIDQSEASQRRPIQNPTREPLFVEVTDSLGIDFSHQEDELVDFKLQPILPHMHSRGGPGIAVADVNADGLEDFFIGGAFQQSGQLFLQKPEGSFEPNHVFDDQYEDMGALFFDADGDGDKDLYVVSGGIAPSDFNPYQDRLYLNDGQGNFSLGEALPLITSSGASVIASDYDKDGDLDLFVAGRIDPGNYPMPAKSYLLENRSDGNPANLKFVDISDTITDWEQLGMVSSALWTDYDQDGWTDLIAVGEFMPITIFRNEKGHLKPPDQIIGLEKSEGWWNSINGGDFDQDGDTDYILGNLGLNTKYRATAEEPLCIYANDYDKDGRLDPVMCYYIDGENHLAHSRDEIIGQINAMRGRFRTYESYAETSFQKSFLPEELEGAYVVKSHNFANSYLENLGQGRFELQSLPLALQTAPIEGIVVKDIDGDGIQDLLLTGNSYATEAATGRYDAMMGSFLKGKGDGTFENIEWEASGFLNDLDGSGLAVMQSARGGWYVLAANNDGPLRIFESNVQNAARKAIAIDGDAQFANVMLHTGKQYRMEFYNGSGYLSQSTGSFTVNDLIKEIAITNARGNTKTVYADETIQ